MKKMTVLMVVITTISSCSIFPGLTSNTMISPDDSFILGNNQHGSFKVVLKNVSKSELEVYLAPIDGGRHSGQMVKPGQSVKVKVDKNTALVINNASSDTASVDLKVSGDTGLSMGYKH